MTNVLVGEKEVSPIVRDRREANMIPISSLGRDQHDGRQILSTGINISLWNLGEGVQAQAERVSQCSFYGTQMRAHSLLYNTHITTAHCIRNPKTKYYSCPSHQKKTVTTQRLADWVNKYMSQEVGKVGATLNRRDRRTYQQWQNLLKRENR